MIEYIATLALGIIATTVDGISTFYGVNRGFAYEANPLTTWFHERFGIFRGQFLKTSYNILIFTLLTRGAMVQNVSFWFLALFFSVILGFGTGQLLWVYLKMKSKDILDHVEAVFKYNKGSDES